MERAAPDPTRYSASGLFYLGPYLLERRGARVLVNRPTSAGGHFWHIRRGLEPRTCGGYASQSRRHTGALRLGISRYLLAQADPGRAPSGPFSQLAPTISRILLRSPRRGDACRRSFHSTKHSGQTLSQSGPPTVH